MKNIAKAVFAGTVLCLGGLNAVAADAPAGPQAFATAHEKEISALNGAFAAVDANQYGAAERSLRSLTRSTDPTIAAMAYQGLAHLYTRSRQFPKVVTAFEEAISLQTMGAHDVDTSALHRLAGQAAVIAGQYDGAITHLTEWQALAKPAPMGTKTSDATTSLAYLAAAQAEKHLFSAAQETVAKAVAMAPSPSARLLDLKSAIDSAASSGTFKAGTIAAIITPRT
jgi:tetratricopeptide (TPR) repeat protein